MSMPFLPGWGQITEAQALVAFIRAHGSEAWEVDGQVLGVADYVAREGELPGIAVAILTSAAEVKAWLGY